MFITKKHIAAADVPARRRRHAGVAAAGIDGAGADAVRLTAAAPVRRFVGIWHPHGAAPGYWSPLQEGQELRVLVHHQAAGAVPQSRGAHQRPRHARGDGHDRRAGRRSRARRGAAVRRAAAAQRRQPLPRRHRSISTSPRSTGRTRSCRRCSSASRTRATSATATGATAAPTPTRSPGRRRRTPLPTQVNPRVVFERLFGDGASAEERLRGRQRNASILDAVVGELGCIQDRSRRRRQGARRHLRRQHPRARAAHPDRDGQRGEGAGRRRAVRAAAEQARPLPPDVRPDGAGVRGRHHALGHLHARPRPERRQLPGVRLQRRLARHVAPRRQAGEHRQLRQGQPLSRAEPRLLLREAEQHPRRRRHACWITC